MSYSEAVEAVGKLIAAFPNGSPQNAKGYIGALAAVLADYPRTIAARCADPLHGVARETRFMPTVADLVGWCEREKASLQQIIDRDDLYKAATHDAEQRAQEAVQLAEARKQRPTLADLKAKYGPNWGIGQSDNEADHVAREVSAERMRQANEALLLREYAAAGVAPITAAPGIAVSVELARQFRARPAPQREAAE